MKIVFRVDSSYQAGSGHLMRCLTLAECLRDQGDEVFFLCRDLDGNLNQLVRDKSFDVLQLSGPCHQSAHLDWNNHATWLGVSREQDASESVAALQAIGQIDWLIVDHYALDQLWQLTLRSWVSRIMVIDDLADRKHDCDLLLDQNLGSHELKYKGLVSPDCKLLIGPQYALIRPEFSELRESSLQRRRVSQIRNIQITMGGVDKDNITAVVLDALKQCDLAPDTKINVILGAASPWVSQVRQTAEQMPWATEVAVNVTDMARRMAEADLSIGAAGSTSWERCCLGLPSILFCLAENQTHVIASLEKAGAALSIPLKALLSNGHVVLQEKINSISSDMLAFIESSVKVTSGKGCDLVAENLYC